MTRRLKDNIHALHILSKSSSKRRKAILKNADKELVTCLCECALNVLKGRVPLSPSQKKKLARHKAHLRALADKKSSHVKRKELLVQKGGFLGPLSQSKLQNLEEDMKVILERTDIPDDTKVSLYQQTLQKYLQYDHARKTEPMSFTMSTPAQGSGTPKSSGDDVPQGSIENDEGTVTSDKQDDLTPQILESVPKTLQRKAKLLMNQLKHNDVMTWNKNGELVYEGDVVKGSNIIDLVNDTLRSKKGFVPRGFQYFMRGLAKSNAPESIIGNEARRSIVRKYKEFGSDKKRLLPDLPTSRTPIPSRRRLRVVSTPLRAKKKLNWETL
ncbi:uncharacterized protein LOC119744384 [Patiria miniata]|uniref:Uncharacterized protein n=1 Tax=Patiria miniata TaxID=46514 RepID=A0A914BJX6_PATMI|nr:uncharacterized protein LOC119744384 [Patiria miniata]